MDAMGEDRPRALKIPCVWHTSYDVVWERFTHIQKVCEKCSCVEALYFLCGTLARVGGRSGEGSCFKTPSRQIDAQCVGCYSFSRPSAVRCTHYVSHMRDE